MWFAVVRLETRRDEGLLCSDISDVIAAGRRRHISRSQQPGSRLSSLNRQLHNEHLILPSLSKLFPTSTPATYNSSDEEDTLPYPVPLPRSSFLSPDFSPQKYLSTLRNRHQTLEDLRSDLRARSQLLSRELLDLVNNNYEDFLSLGEDLRSGGEKVEGVRVGVLGFQREVEGLRGLVKEREAEVGKLVCEKKKVREDVRVGRGLVEVWERIRELEESLSNDDDDEDDEDEDEGETGGLKVVRRLQRLAREYVLLTRLVERLGTSHPFLQAQQARIVGVRKMLLLDLGAAVRQAKKEKSGDAMLALIRLYAELGAEGEGVKLLRGK